MEHEGGGGEQHTEHRCESRISRDLLPALSQRAAMLLANLPADVVALVLVQLGRGKGRASDIARVAPTCRALRDAARAAEKAHRRVCFEHGSGVTCVAAAPGGRVLVGSDDRTIKVWRDGACERTIQGKAVAVLPSGARFVSGSHDGTAKLWTTGGALERTFAMGDRVLVVAALPDGVHFVVGCYGYNGVRLYHVDGTLVHSFEVHYSTASTLAVTPDGQHIITPDGQKLLGEKDTLVKVWSVATKSLVSTCACTIHEALGHTGMVFAVAAMPDSQRIISSSRGDVRVHLLNGTLENTFDLHADSYALVALPDNQHALSGSGDATVKLFNVNDGTVLRTFMHHTGRVECLALLPDGLRFVSGSGDGTARIVDHGLVTQ